MNKFDIIAIGALVFAFGMGFYFYIPTIADGFLETGLVDEDVTKSDENITFDTWNTAGDSAEFWTVDFRGNVLNGEENVNGNVEVFIEHRENETAPIQNYTSDGFFNASVDQDVIFDISFVVPPNEQFRLVNISENFDVEIERSRKVNLPTSVIIEKVASITESEIEEIIREDSYENPKEYNFLSTNVSTINLALLNSDDCRTADGGRDIFVVLKSQGDDIGSGDVFAIRVNMTFGTSAINEYIAERFIRGGLVSGQEDYAVTSTFIVPEGETYCFIDESINANNVFAITQEYDL